MCACVRACVPACLHACVRVCVRSCMCLCVYEIERERERERESKKLIIFKVYIIIKYNEIGNKVNNKKNIYLAKLSLFNFLDLYP